MTTAERKSDRHSVRVGGFVSTVVLLAGALFATVIFGWGPPDFGQVAFFWALHSLTLFDRIEVPVQRLSVLREDEPRGVVLSPGFIVLLTAAFGTSPSTAMAVALLPAIPGLINAGERRVLKVVFNSGQEAVYVGLAAVSFSILDSAHVVSGFVAATVAAVFALALNTVLVAGVIALERGMSWRDIVRRMTWTVPHSIAFGLVALMIATLYQAHGALAAAFLFMPIAALRIARQAKMQLDRVRDQTIMDFVRAVEAKDPYTFRHSERVAAIVVELHRELGAGLPDLERRWSAAVLHDVGKVIVPVEILTKPGSLTPDEFDVIKLHPGVGADAVGEIDLFKDLVPEIRYHHERLDGRGYPDGLIAEDIPYNARVLAVADAFEALTSNRPYRTAHTAEAALQELRDQAGKHHEPVIVDALGRILGRGVSFVRPDAPISTSTDDKHDHVRARS